MLNYAKKWEMEPLCEYCILMYIKQVLLGIQFRNFRQLWYLNFLTTPRPLFITHIKASIVVFYKPCLYWLIIWSTTDLRRRRERKRYVCNGTAGYLLGVLITLEKSAVKWTKLIWLSYDYTLRIIVKTTINYLCP